MDKQLLDIASAAGKKQVIALIALTV